VSVPRASVRAWLQVRQPGPPADLAAKLADSVGSAPESVFAGESLPAVLGALGTWLLTAAVERKQAACDAPDAGRPEVNTSDAPPAGTRLDAGAAAPDEGRPEVNTSDAPPAGTRPDAGAAAPDASAAAMELLAADAFVTYAFEAASEEGSDVTGLAHQLLTMVRA